MLDATVTEQAMRFPTDLSLLNESREIRKDLIDDLYTLSSLALSKPRTYHKTTLKSGSATLPFFGIKHEIMGSQGTIMDGVAEGILVISLQWPEQARIIYGGS